MWTTCKENEVYIFACLQDDYTLMIVCVFLKTFLSIVVTEEDGNVMKIKVVIDGIKAKFMNKKKSSNGTLDVSFQKQWVLSTVLWS